MRVLVTGGGGFLGLALVRRLLERGDAVRTLSRNEHAALASTGADVVRGDVAEADAVGRAVHGCDAVLHTAARVGAWGRREDFERTNVLGTRNVIEACLRHGVGRLVYTSSPSVVNALGDLEGVDEAHPSEGAYLADYPRTKAEAERAVLAANGAKLATVALRPHLMWGPGDTQLVPRLVAKARARRVILPSGPERLVDCTYIDNAVDAHLLALDALRPGATCAGKPYFISQGQPVSSRWLVNAVLAAAGLPAGQRTLSPRALYAAGFVAEVVYRALGVVDREPPITRFIAHELCTAHWFDIAAARRDLGYVPRVSIEEGLRRLKASLES